MEGLECYNVRGQSTRINKDTVLQSMAAIFADRESNRDRVAAVPAPTGSKNRGNVFDRKEPMYDFDRKEPMYDFDLRSWREA